MGEKHRGRVSVFTATGIQMQVVWRHNPTSCTLYLMRLVQLVDNKRCVCRQAYQPGCWKVTQIAPPMGNSSAYTNLIKVTLSN